MQLEQELKEKTADIEKLLERMLPEEAGLQKTIFSAMRYSLMAGGKRIRPLLIAETYRFFGGTDMALAEPFMAAIEMIHTYSLIHDDLPALDNDDYRRGRLTSHKVYGEAMAILAGDGLLNLAYETAVSAVVKSEGNIYAVRALDILAKSAGIYGMVGGQTVDVENDGVPLKQEQLDFIYRLKTGALIQAAMHMGAVLAGATKNEQDAICQIASNIGLAFQIQDDILDVTGTLEEIGKPVGSDEKNEKTTYVTLEGLKKAQSDVERLTEESVELMQGLVVKNEFLTELLQYLVHRKK